MRLETIKKLQVITEEVAGFFGAVSIGAVILGGYSFGLGSVAKGLTASYIPDNEVQLNLNKFIYAGSATATTGFVIAGITCLVGNATANYLRNKELKYIIANSNNLGFNRKSSFLELPKNCLHCQYFSGNSKLYCAVNPELPKDCKDFESKF